MANINGHEIFFGIVGQVDATEDKLPSWFPDDNVIQRFYEVFGNDKSDYYIDLCWTIDIGPARYVYARLYCDTENSLKIFINGTNQIFVENVSSGSKVAQQQLLYDANGDYYDDYEEDWSSTSSLVTNNFHNYALIHKGTTCYIQGNIWIY